MKYLGKYFTVLSLFSCETSNLFFIFYLLFGLLPVYIYIVLAILIILFSL